MHVAHGGLQLVMSAAERILQPRDLRFQLFELGFQFEDPPDSGQAHAVVGELLDPLEEGDVTVGVPPAATLRAARLDQAFALVDPQSLRMDTRQLGRHRDDVQRSLVAIHRYTPKCSRGLPGRAAESSSKILRAPSSSSVGTTTSNVTRSAPGSADARGIPRPRTRTVLPL